MRRSDFFKKAGFAAISAPLYIKNVTVKGKEKPVKPKRLKPGDTVAFTAPAGIVHDASDFTRMRRILESFGLNVVFGEFVRKRDGYFAGNDYQRATDLNRFIADPSVSGIIAARGGWGSSRILPYVDFELFRKNPKVFCGFSDITTLHLAFLAHSGVVTFHGPNGTSDWTDLTKEYFKRVLIDGEAVCCRSRGRVTTIYPGIAEGELTGGNLTVFTTSIGTSYQPDTKDKILFLEDIGEPPYKIDRMLTHIKAAGMLEGLSGFIFGRCTNCPGNTGSGFTKEEVIHHHIGPLGIPAVTGTDIGHDPDNFTLPMGIRSRLDAESGIIELTEPGVG